MNINIKHVKYLSFILFFFAYFIFYLIFNQYIIALKKEGTIQRINQNLRKINRYMRLCKSGILLRGILKSCSKPKITALITVHNSQQYVKSAITSVQNQNYSDIEILIIDDCSNDQSSNIINQLKNSDNRIKVIRNKINRGILYSKSLGILKSKGKFIMFLDSDDMFVNQNIFSICIEEALKNDIDIVEFSGFESDFNQFKLNNSIPKIPLYLRYKKNNEIIKQPHLSSYLYRKLEDNEYKLLDGFLWGKCIKAFVLKNTLKKIGPHIYKRKLNYGDDRLINFVLFKTAKSFKFIREFGYIYNQNNMSITHLNLTSNNCKDELTNIFFIYNITKKTRECEIAVFEILHRWEKIIYPGLNNCFNKKLLISLFEEMIKNIYISEISKSKLLNLINHINIF